VSDIAGISPENREKERAVLLLIRAVHSLPREEQDAVFALLLGGLAGPQSSLGANPTWGLRVVNTEDARRAAVAFAGVTPPSSDARVLPIRLPSRRYEELKAWCEEHHFPMAAVVRGLVERFLESQPPA
jgi:hypothetical protein